jgi:acetyl-CoA C-acetyltransferase
MSALIAGYARTPFSRFNGRFASSPRHSPWCPCHHRRPEPRRCRPGGSSARDSRACPAGRSRPEPGPAICCGGRHPPERSCTDAECSVSFRNGGRRRCRTPDRNRGEADVVVALGQESMSLAPHVFNARAGQKYGALEVVDTLEIDGLTDAFERRSMGISTEDGNTDYAWIGPARTPGRLLRTSALKRTLLSMPMRSPRTP